MTDPTEGRDPNWLWSADPPVGEGRQLLELVRMGKLRPTPRKARMRRDGPAAFLEGWAPSEPLIGPESRVTAMGSCFAALFSQWLVETRLSQHASAGERLLRAGLDSPVSVAQHLRWAFGEVDSESVLWYDRAGTLIQPTQDDRMAVRTTIETSDVAIMTLGLAEVWYDAETGEPLWRVPPARMQESRFLQRVISVADCVFALETIERLRATHTPHLKLVYTVSPVRLAATFRPINPLVANSASKAIVRAAVDEYLRAAPDLLGKSTFYYPSYEIVREFFADPYYDNLHVHTAVSDVVIDTFVRAYTSLADGVEAPPLPDSAITDRAMLEHYAELEQLYDELQVVANERLAVIEQLKQAADERLAAIEELKQAADDRLELVERLSAELDRLRPSAVSDAGL